MQTHIKRITSVIAIAALTFTMFLSNSIDTMAKSETVKLSGESSDFVLLSDVVPDAIQEIRYYSTYNFVGDRIAGYEEPVALITKEAAVALKEVSDELVGKGYRLKIYDAYRPQMAVTNFMNWALDTSDIRMKQYFYPELDKSVLFPQGYIAEHSGHSRGSTVDLTLFDMTTEKEVDMGGTFDYFGELSHPDYKGITEQQYANRMLLRDVMMRHGFNPLEEEWWHFTLKNEPYKDTYFTFPVTTKSVVSSANTHKVSASTTTMLGDSPKWITNLPQSKNTSQMLVVAAYDTTVAWISLNEKGTDGKWRTIITTPGFIGKNGLGKTKEGDAKTPVGTFSFNAAFGIAPDPGCSIPYIQVGDDQYWSGDVNPGMQYNKMVNIKDYPNLDKENSEHIIEYTRQYQYCLNISYNAEGTPGLGSAIFLHCMGPSKPYTGGCVAVPENQMKLIMQNVKPDCTVIIDTMGNLGAEF
ncbi:D-alanyl-D-alanine dipeptidase [Pseudobutyrivibrio sp. ACV-2]|uniref:M15 family metallopeptidase n=1 Tax=Pseudobutyrivibrio sp. ACV-2 TaxID=1520801 RepID=UPI000895623B|nr:M15 family metallopeptidase [Pseudobutyrivibrio sp. ACV-2]SEB02521.1 D-alanyl-D-alanine dipeptidase [Pseudobutyrivibrio sp. ACV-2]